MQMARLQSTLRLGFYVGRTGTNQETSPMEKKPVKNPIRHFGEHLAVYKLQNLLKAIAEQK